MEEGEIGDGVYAPAAAASLPPLGPLRQRHVRFAERDDYEPDARDAMAVEASRPRARGRSVSPSPRLIEADPVHTALLDTLHEGEAKTLARLARAERGGQLAFGDVFDLFRETGEISLDVVQKIVRRQTVAAMSDGLGRDPRPCTSENKAFWAAAPRGLLVSRAEGLATPDPPADVDPNIHPRASGDVMLAMHVEDGCEDCAEEKECYIWSLRASLAGMRLPFIEGMRPTTLLDPEADSWKCADLATERGRAHVEQVNELIACGVLRPCVNDGTGAIAPSHVVRRQVLSTDVAERAAIEGYDQREMQRLAERRAERIFRAANEHACGRAWTADHFAAAQAAHRDGPIKWRLVVSLNLTINKLVEDWNFTYINFAEVFGPSWHTLSLVGKNDLVKGFYCVQVAEEDRKYFRIRDPSDPTGRRLLEFVRLPMGYKLSPAVFSGVTAELERHFKRSVYGKAGAAFGFFVDDLGICADGRDGFAAATQDYVRTEATKARFKWGTGPGKDEQMAQANDITGLRFDSNVDGAPMVRVAANSLYTTLVDLALIRIAIERAPLEARFPVEFLRSTAGRTSWVAQTMYSARLRVGALWYAASHAGRRRGTVRVAAIGGLLDDATWFAEQAAAGRLRGSRRVRAGQLTRESVVPLFGDASGAKGAGFGVVCLRRALWHEFTHAELCWSIQAQELATFVAAAERWGAEWAGRLVLIYTDNFGNALGINSAKALKGPALALLRRLYELADFHGFDVLSLWLPREFNKQADAVSKAKSLAAARRAAVACGAVAREEDVEEV